MTSARKLSLLAPIEDVPRNSESVDQLASYFYKISNHEELFKIGKGFLIDVNKGVKNFAITSTGYKNSQQKTILGLCCYFDHNSKYKIAIITDLPTKGFFAELVDASMEGKYKIGDSEDYIKYKSFHNHFDFVDYSELMRCYNQHLHTKKFESEIKKILEKYDLVFWDIPEMEKLQQNSRFHYRISQFYESMTVVVGQSSTSGKQIETIKNFFGNFNINLNGVLFDTSSSDNPLKKKRKKFLGLF